MIRRWLWRGRKAVREARRRSELQRRGVVLDGPIRGLQDVRFAGKAVVGPGTRFVGDVSVGDATTIGFDCYFHGSVTVGNYCQIGPRVAVIALDHPTCRATTYLNRSL